MIPTHVYQPVGWLDGNTAAGSGQALVWGSPNQSPLFNVVAMLFNVEAMVPTAGGGLGSPKRRRSRKITEESIYTEAGLLFAAGGYAATSLERIATKVGVHKSTIFHYVDSKEDLLAIVLDRAFKSYVSSLEAIMAGSDDSRGRLEAAIRNHIDFVFDHGSELQIFIRERQRLSGRLSRFYLHMTERYQELFTGLIDEAMTAGALPTGNPALTARLLLGGANSIVEWYYPMGALSREEISTHYVELMLR